MFCPITPQKRSYQAFHYDEYALKELSPFPQSTIMSSQRKNLSLQLLQSPIPTNRDLFSQLLATEIKTPCNNLPQFQIDEDEGFEEYNRIQFKDSQSQEESLQEIDEQSSQENGIKKRKRKSTAQIKILKHELDVDPNWSKDKIVQMSDITGLSQSQVYKWWWDQKKKNVKSERQAYSKMMKRKIIHKDLERKVGRDQRETEEKGHAFEETYMATKIKANVQIQHTPETERKISKRLVFA